MLTAPHINKLCSCYIHLDPLQLKRLFSWYYLDPLVVLNEMSMKPIDKFLIHWIPADSVI